MFKGQWQQFSWVGFIFESVGRFYNHIKVFHCEKFQQSLHTKKLGHLVSLSLTERFWFCSGLCQMRVTKKKENNDEVNSGKSRFMRTVRNTIYRNRLVGDTPIQSEEVTWVKMKTFGFLIFQNTFHCSNKTVIFHPQSKAFYTKKNWHLS